ncbi:nucleotidyl transferase AbiEii/AbiGii toxin family protein [Parolsenella catena]|uniref:nucleotidyl transferase AbiEii/AbiGii toxin family protein n=1 Tax=Parolsenella catena TaxID=2003188 RepID=UPI002E75F554|nr:nucleotidyl transferase AbiEii/AbiGii toxin family protein [Parolsenella catena]
MSTRTYKTAAALEMAVKAAARKSDQDTSRAIQDFYPGRLLERVFSEENSRFVLKGGRSVLARTVDARYTRDTDFLYEGDNLDKALEELKRLAATDLGDFIEFKFVSASSIAEEQEYRSGYRVVFTPVLGGTKKMSDVSIDLVVDQVPTSDADIVKPANRLDIEGLPVFDYHIYPAVCAIADKTCATMQTYTGNRPSSRVRDLVDIVVYLTTETIDGHSLSTRLALEMRLRGLSSPGCFTIPQEWRTASFSKTYAKCAKEANLPKGWQKIEAAEQLAKKCIDPAISGEAESMSWNPEELEWNE